MSKGKAAAKPRGSGKTKGKDALELIEVRDVEIDDENWQCLICFLMEVDMDSVPYARSILNVIQNGLRWVVKSISYSGVLKAVEQSAFKHGNYSGFTSIYQSTYDRLCEEALECLNNEEDNTIPNSLMARLIKCDILKMKEEDLRRREMKRTIAEEKAEEIKKRFDPGYSQSPPKKDAKPPAKPDKSPKGDKTAGRPTLNVKRDTKLRRRGEEWMDIEYIEDSPDDGPDAYITLMEFLDTDLLLELLQIGVNLRYVIRINVNPPLIDTSILKHRRTGNARKKLIKRQIAELRDIETINIVNKLEDPDLYEVRKKLINRTKNALKFWQRLNDDLSDLPTMLYYKDIGFVDFVVSETPISLNDAGDELSAEIVLYDEISYFMYDLYKTFHNYITYLKNMHVCDLNYKPDESLQEMLVYERLTQSLPLECTCAAIVLHCMIEQIEYSEEADYVTVHDYVTLVGANLTTKYEGIPDPVKDFLEDVLQSFDDSSSVSDTVSLAEFSEPLVVIYGDEILRRNYHYKFEYVDSEDVHLDLSKLLPPVTLWDRYTPKAKEDILSLRCHSKVLLSCMQDMSSYTLMFDNLYVYLFHMLCCHRRRDNILSASQLIIDRRRCMCTEYPFAHQDVIDLLDYDDEFDEEAEEDKDISFFDKYRYVEQMGTSIFLQALETAFRQFGKPAHFYCALSDSIVLAFSCQRDDNGIKETSYAKPLTVPIGFRDFCSFVINAEWEPPLSTGQPSYSGSSLLQTSKISSLTVAPVPFPDTHFLLKGSIKWQLWQEELAAAAAAEAEALQQAKNLQLPRAESERLKHHELETGAHEEIPEELTLSQLDVEGGGPPLPSYPLGPHRVQFSSVAKECRLSDCCEVEVKMLERLYSRQWVSLRLKKAGHELYFHESTWPPVAGEPAQKERPLGFFLRLSRGIIFSFRKTVTPSPFACRCSEVPFTMEVSWPCGLHIQLVPPCDKAPFYVRQTYLAHHPGVRPSIAEEKKRCFLADGHVLRFTEDEKVHVLCPNSSVFVCQVELEVVRSPSPQSSESKASATKASTRKGRNVSKSKKRASSKASQIAKSEIEVPVVETPPEVKGNVTSYTSVSPDGRQWQWQMEEGGERTEVLPRHLLRTYTDWEIHETFQRRGDDTNILTKADGTRIVSFPGDTRISNYAWENESEVFCEWSSEELDQYYEWYALRHDRRFLRRRLLPSGALALLDEGYVYVRIKFRMEHPNYATVVATGRDLPLELIMPEQTRVLVYPEGRFLVEASDGVTLDVRRSSAVFTHSDRCESELDFDGYNFTDDTRNWKRPLCRTVDHTGKRFDVNYMGDTTCDEADPEWSVPRPYADYRCLILNRDLSGRELIHEEAAEEWLAAALSRHDEAVVDNQLSFAPNLSYHLTMGPLGEDESERWLVPPLEKGLTQAERKGVNRIPSTYGSPPSWFHPFPMRRGQQGQEEEELVSNPEVLQVRLLSELAPAGARVVSAVADALAGYLLRGADLLEEFSAASDVYLQYHSSDELVRQLQKSATRQNVLSRAHMRPRWQDKTSPAALELYRVVMARRGRLTDEEMEAASRRWVDQAACLAIALSRIRRRLRTAEENRRALRERIIPPYFRSHWGRAFTFTDDLTTRAVHEALGVQPEGSGGSGSGSGSDISRDAALAVSQLM